VLAIAGNHVKIPLRRRLAAVPMRKPATKPSKRWTAIRLVTLVGVCSLVAACGSSSPASQRKAIRAVVTNFLYALAHGDGDVACAHATPSGQQKIVNAIGPELQNFDIYGCADVVYTTGAQMTAAHRKSLETARVGKIALQKSTATIPLSSLTSPDGSVDVVLGTKAPVRLIDSYGVWLIISL
jgi:hypothetical protein